MSIRWPRPAKWPVYAVPLLLALFEVMGTFGALHNPHAANHRSPRLAIALVLAGVIALLARRRQPVPVLVVTGGLLSAYLLLGYGAGPIFLTSIVAAVGAVTSGRRTEAWIVYAVLIVILNAVGLLGVGGWTITAAVGTAAWAILVLALAELVRIRSERAAEADRVRAEQGRRQASEERLRIARELHDVLAHNISMINVQAGVALHLMDEKPEQARTALTAIKEASKEALTEVRSVLGVLRQVDEAAPRSPAAGLARLPDLVTRADAAGITVRTRTLGEPYALPAGVDLAAFRIVQEALTNVTRHAGPGTTATIQLAYGDGELLIRVEDDGTSPVPTAGEPGNGITGMRERTTALGGDLEAGPRPGPPGFRVQARLPVEEQR